MQCMRQRRSVCAAVAALIVTGVAILAGARPAYARETYTWAHVLTGGQIQQVSGVDSQGGDEVLVGGTFRGTVDFDPGPGERLLSSAKDAGFIAKYGPAGNLIWARAITGSDDIRVNDLAVDVINQIAVVGSFRGEVDLDPGPGVHSVVSQGSSDIFLLRLYPDGTLDWAFTTGDGDSDAAVSVAVDDLYNIYIAGNYEGKVPFDPAPSKVVLESQGNDDAFAAYFTNYGRLLWAKSFGGPRDDGATSIAIDGKRQIYLAGTFEGEADLDPDYTDFEAKSQGGSDIFVVVLQVGGRLFSAAHFGGPSDDGSPKLAVEPDGMFYVAGQFKGTVDFNRAAEGGVVASRGEADIFLLRYRPGQHLLWVFGLGSARTDGVGGLTQDTLGNLYMLGTFEESVDFDPGPGAAVLTSLSADDLFLARYTADGVLRDVQHVQGGADETAVDIAASPANQIVLAGMFQGTLDFGRGLTATGTPDGTDDVFVARLPAETWAPNYSELALPLVRQTAGLP